MLPSVNAYEYRKRWAPLGTLSRAFKERTAKQECVYYKILATRTSAFKFLDFCVSPAFVQQGIPGFPTVISELLR